MRILIRNGKLVFSERTLAGDLLIENGKISAIGADLGAANVVADVVHDIGGQYLLPGGVDVHTNFGFRWNGVKAADDFHSGTRAALCGGTTTVVQSVLQEKGVALRGAFENAVTQAGEKALCDFGVHLFITDPPKKPEKDLATLIDEGVTSFKCTMAFKGMWQLRVDFFYKILNVCKRYGALLMVHAEDGDQIEKRAGELAGENKRGMKFYPMSRPPLFEQEAAYRVMTLAKMAQHPIYLMGVSSKDAINVLIQSEEEKIPIFSETCPHYLVLSDRAYDGDEGARYVTAPPLRTEEDQMALWRSIKAGLIDVISSGHVALDEESCRQQEDRSLAQVIPGIPGVGQRLSLLYHFGVASGRISINQLVDICATRPAKLFGLYPQKGTLEVGADADLVIFDSRIPNSENLQHFDCAYNPYRALDVKGSPSMVFKGGELVYQSGLFTEPKKRGLFIKRARLSSYA